MHSQSLTSIFDDLATACMALHAQAAAQRSAVLEMEAVMRSLNGTIEGLAAGARTISASVDAMNR